MVAVETAWVVAFVDHGSRDEGATRSAKNRYTRFREHVLSFGAFV